MRQLKNMAAALIICAGSFAANAQTGQLKLDLNYNYSLPMGSFKNNLISNGSGNGFSGSIQYGINDKWAVGLGLAYQDYHQNIRALYTL